MSPVPDTCSEGSELLGFESDETTSAVLCQLTENIKQIESDESTSAVLSKLTDESTSAVLYQLTDEIKQIEATVPACAIQSTILPLFLEVNKHKIWQHHS
jgi:hypothetical protein